MDIHEMIQPEGDSLFLRVASILEQARRNVVRSVNTNMVLAYWLIGREIVQALQGGEDRAEYGKRLIENLSARLTDKYGKGFSSPTLRNFRLFYQVYASRHAILSPAGRELQNVEKLHPTGGELTPKGKRSLAGSQFQGFSPQLSWSHYRALMRVQDDRLSLARNISAWTTTIFTSIWSSTTSCSSAFC